MANYEAVARSNYFRVKDEGAFRKDMERIDAEVVVDNEGRLGIIGTRWESGFPTSVLDENDEAIDIDVSDLVAQHLCPDEVAVLEEAGYESFRYVNAYAVAINAEGEVRSLGLHQIYDAARELGRNVTLAAY